MRREFSKALLRLARCKVLTKATRVTAGSSRSVK